MTPNFHLAEFVRSTTAARLGVSNALPAALMPAALQTLQMMQRIRDRLCVLAGRDIPVTITSGYRCPEHNMAVGDSGASGPHTTGRAVDIAVSRDRASRLVKAALGMGFMGIGLKQHGPESGRFVHLDTLASRAGQIIWTY
jgi:uncharacterized protein YcbK (DUF882 family)